MISTVVAECLVAEGALLMAGGIFGRLVALRRKLTVPEARVLRRCNASVWIGWGVVQGGLAASMLLGGSDSVAYHLSHPLVWLQGILLLLLAGAETVPTHLSLGFGRYLRQSQIPWFTDGDYLRVRIAALVQLAFFLPLPFLWILVREGHLGGLR